MRTWMTSMVAVGAWSVLSLSASAQNPNQQQPQQPQQGAVNAGKTMRAKVTRVEGTDRIMVRTNDNRDVVFFANPQTRFMVNGRQARIADLQSGNDINVIYTVDGERHVVSQVQVGEATATTPGVDDRRFRGKITKIVSREQFVAKAQTGKEANFYTQPQAQITIDGKAGKIDDLKVGMDVDVQYIERNDQWWVESVMVAPATTQNNNPNQNPNANEVVGTVVRIQGNDHVVVKTADGNEVTVYVAPQTTYSLDNQPSRLADLQPGSTIRVQTETRDRRLFGRSFLGLRRTNR
jgi:translation initiation factor IF-1